MEMYCIWPRWLNVTTYQLVSLCLLLVTLNGRTGDTAGVPSTRLVNDPDTATICDCPMSSSFLSCQTSAEGTTECEADEVRDGDSCYRFITESRRTHEGALLDCIERNSHLVYIESMEEQNFIVSRASTLIRIDYWIGLIAKKTYTWSDGTVQVPERLIIVGSIGECVQMRHSSNVLLFFTSRCLLLRNFVCETDTTPTGCPNNWHPFGNSCYEVVQESHQRRTQGDARRFCEGRGGHLVYLETREELNDVRMLLPQNGATFWTGLMIVEYHWMDGTPALFQIFDPVNGDDGNECFRMRPHSLNWNDRGCHNLFGYICERKLSLGPIDQSVDCPSSPPGDLMFLSQSGAMFVDDDDDTTPILRSRDTGNGIGGCGCGQTNDDLVSCSVGSCKMTFSNTDHQWPSQFNCSCYSHVRNTTFDLIADQGSIVCPIQLLPTTPMSTTTMPTTTLSTTMLPTTTLPTTTLPTTTLPTTTLPTTTLPTTTLRTTTLPTTTLPTTTLPTTTLPTTTLPTTTLPTTTLPKTTLPTTTLPTTTLPTTTLSTTTLPTTTTTLSTTTLSTTTWSTTTMSTSEAASSSTTSRDDVTNEAGAASGRRGGADRSTGLTVGVTVGAVSVVGAVIGAVVWKKLGGTLALKATEGSLGSPLTPSAQLAGPQSAGKQWTVNPMYGLNGDTLAAGSDVLAGVTEGGMYGVRNPIYEGWKGDVDPI